MRLHQFLSDSAGRLGAKTAIVAGAARHSYADLDRKSDRLAAALVSRGLAPGDRVVVFLDNGFAAVVALFAVAKAGGVFTPVDPATAADALAFVFDSCRALAIVTQARLASVAAAAMTRASTVKLVVLAGGNCPSISESCLSFEDVVNRAGRAPALAAGGGDDDRVVLVHAPDSIDLVEPTAMSHRQVAAAVAAQSPDGGDAVRVPSISSAHGLCRLLAAVRVGATLVLEGGPATADAAGGGRAGGRFHERVAVNWSRA